MCSLPDPATHPATTHCSCRRLPLRSALTHGNSAQAHASDTAEGPSLCLSSEPHSSPLLWPLVSPASTRCPRKTASVIPAEQRGTTRQVILMPPSYHPHQTRPAQALKSLQMRALPHGQSYHIWIPLVWRVVGAMPSCPHTLWHCTLHGQEAALLFEQDKPDLLIPTSGGVSPFPDAPHPS